MIVNCPTASKAAGGLAETSISVASAVASLVSVPKAVTSPGMLLLLIFCGSAIGHHLLT
jgi:hypothetical protein